MLLLHGVRGSRLQMLSRARWLHGAGYSVLLIDFQAHGERTGTQISFGLKESQDAAAALQFLHAKAPGEKVAAIAMSLGGAAALLGEQPLPVDALVLESVYPTIDEAVEDRLRIRLGGVAPLVAPLLLWQSKLFLGVSTQRLRPIDHTGEVACPVFVIHGAEDQHTTIDEAKRLFDNAPETKTFWMVDGAAHQDLYAFATEEYQRRVSTFIKTAFQDQTLHDQH